MTTKKRNTKKTNANPVAGRDGYEWHATGCGGGHWVRRDAADQASYASTYYARREETLLAIAQEVLGLTTLETRNSDRLDFHELAVWQLQKALRNAYIAGHAAGLKAGGEVARYRKSNE